MLSDLFFTLNFSFAIFASIVGLVLSFLTVLIVIKNREFHTFHNVLLCNTCVGISFYSIITILSSIIAFREDWAFNAPLCSLRAYCLAVFIAIICHSKSIQAISRLFSAVLYKHKYLLTWRVHWILIILNWMLSIIACIPPFFIEGGYGFERESRLCVGTFKIYVPALYISFILCIFPSSIIITINIIIFCSVYRSTRRVRAVAFDHNQNPINNHNHIQKAKRELKLMRQMTLQASVFGCGGILFLILIGWNATYEQPPPESLYLLALNFITMTISMIPLLQFIVYKHLRESAVRYFYRRPAPIMPAGPNHRQAWHIA